MNCERHDVEQAMDVAVALMNEAMDTVKGLYGEPLNHPHLVAALMDVSMRALVSCGRLEPRLPRV
jgi:hypothetical protein